MIQSSSAFLLRIIIEERRIREMIRKKVTASSPSSESCGRHAISISFLASLVFSFLMCLSFSSKIKKSQWYDPSRLFSSPTNGRRRYLIFLSSPYQEDNRSLAKSYRLRTKQWYSYLLESAAVWIQIIWTHFYIMYEFIYGRSPPLSLSDFSFLWSLVMVEVMLSFSNLGPK